MTPVTKMHRALSSIDRRLGVSWEKAQLAGAKRRPPCECRLDRLEVTASEMDESLVLAIPGFRQGRNHYLRRKNPKDFLPYGRRTEYMTNGSISQVVVLSEPSISHIAPCKVTLIARDEVGLEPKDVLSVLELLPGAKVVLVEIAFDFGYSAGVDGAWVRSHSLFGKARRNQVGIRRGWDAWGSRRGAKFVRSYYKKELKIHRLELQLNRKFLRCFGIKDIFDFRRLMSILPVNHLLFAEIDNAKLLHHLRMGGHWGSEFWQILERVADGSGDLLLQCAVLRKRGGLKNVRRVLIPLEENHLIVNALQKWAAQWPDKPRQLGRKG